MTGESAPRLRRWRLGIPFLAMHAACALVLVVGWSPIALVVAVGLFVLRAFGITAFYHRGLAHRSFRASRPVMFAGAALGAAAAQLGPLWWAAHHRMHHRATERDGDPHSPVTLGFWRSHMLWVFEPANRATRLELVPDLACYPELRFLDRAPYVAPITLAVFTFGLGGFPDAVAPGLGTSAGQMLVWGFFVSTVALYHVTFAVNSVAHSVGPRRFATRDQSRNLWWLAVLSLGEGWHNSHHHHPAQARIGAARRELDLGWLGLRALAAVGLVRDLRGPGTRPDTEPAPVSVPVSVPVRV